MKKKKSKIAKSKKKTIKKEKPKVSVFGVPDFDKSLTVVMENKSDEEREVSLFSLDNPVPDDVSVSVRESSYKFVMETLENSIFSIGFRLSGRDISDFLNPIQVSKKSRFGSRASYPLFPMLYMSPNQYMSSIVEMFPYTMHIEKGFEMQFTLAPKSSMVSIFFVKEFKDQQEFLSKGNDLKKRGSEKFYGTAIPIVLENTTDEKREVSFFDLSIFDGKETIEQKQHAIDSLPVRVTMPLSSYLEFLLTLEMQEENQAKYFDSMNRIKIWSDNKEQMRNFIEVQKQNGSAFSNEVINPTDFYSPTQFQDKLIDGAFTLDWDKNTSVKVTVEPKTKVMYLFYEFAEIEDRGKDFGIGTDKPQLISTKAHKLPNFGSKKLTPAMVAKLKGAK